ncbi:class I SAM-dependent methyltransferase [Kordiimonas pumila]|uniref:Class I SAM-dependent methyltransferase n=1 Tax=Kordiimonas pumila TaxID=2161677 RepID=A0ABV7D4R1_9PROT|nr:class I SAM-dependent methyltransferase [Kordiimonas pumila]
MIKNFMIAGVLAASFLGYAQASETEDVIWHAVHENSLRSEEDTARDVYRHPEEFLRFLGIKSNMAVGEVNPGSFWYSRILADVLRENGTYVGLEHHPDQYAQSPKYAVHLREFPAIVKKNPDMFGANAIGTWIPASEGLPVEAGSLDMIIAVRAFHNWKRRGFFDVAMDQTWSMLKDGGVLGIVQHRAAEDAPEDADTLYGKGRWKQSAMIAAVEAKGFKLVETSEINANPKDVGGYPVGVWNLPPSLSGGETDKEKYIAIGESDRMTLKFIKVAR